MLEFVVREVVEVEDDALLSCLVRPDDKAATFGFRLVRMFALVLAILPLRAVEGEDLEVVVVEFAALLRW